MFDRQPTILTSQIDSGCNIFISYPIFHGSVIWPLRIYVDIHCLLLNQSWYPQLAEKERFYSFIWFSREGEKAARYPDGLLPYPRDGDLPLASGHSTRYRCSWQDSGQRSWRRQRACEHVTLGREWRKKFECFWMICESAFAQRIGVWVGTWGASGRVVLFFYMPS